MRLETFNQDLFLAPYTRPYSVHEIALVRAFRAPSRLPSAAAVGWLLERAWIVDLSEMMPARAGRCSVEGFHQGRHPVRTPPCRSWGGRQIAPGQLGERVFGTQRCFP